jgi:tetratricopeptide (TPR) repeat protein
MNEDINQELLNEVQKLVKELQKSKRSNQVLVVVLFVVFVLVGLSHSKSSEPTHSWSAVQTAVRQLDYPKALSLAQANVAIQPSDYYGHSYLGIIYLAMGDVTNSEAEYLRACQLFPSEDNEKNLAAVRKRLAAGGDFKLLSK